jgi:hypothetical protein
MSNENEDGKPTILVSDSSGTSYWGYQKQTYIGDQIHDPGSGHLQWNGKDLVLEASRAIASFKDGDAADIILTREDGSQISFIDLLRRIEELEARLDSLASNKEFGWDD